jgi:hypothetical protein
MIDKISDVSPKQVLIPPNNAVFDKNSENEKSIKSDQKVEGTTTKNVIENGKLIVPGYLPPGEKG